MEASHVSDKKECVTCEVPKDACHISFLGRKVAEGEVEKAVVVNMETVRGEMIVMDINSKGQVLGIDLFAPGTKACQPVWTHVMDEEKQ